MQIFLKKRRLPPSFDSPSIPSCPVGALASTNFRSSDAQKQSLGATHVNIPAKGTMNGRMRFYSKKILAVHALVLVILGRECHSSLLALLGERRRRFGTRPRLLRRRPIPGIPAGSLHTGRTDQWLRSAASHPLRRETLCFRQSLFPQRRTRFSSKTAVSIFAWGRGAASAITGGSTATIFTR